MQSSIWIDLDNSPHVPLFAPIIRHFREAGVDVVLTARDHSQTVELLDLAGLAATYTIIGRHYGKGSMGKVRGLAVRSKQLIAHINEQKKHMSVAVSHGSRSMVLAARWLKVPVVTMYDYEFTETRVFNRFSTKVLVPELIPDGVLDEIRLPVNKRVKYPGIKEEVYLQRFVPEPEFRKRFLADHGHDDDSKVLVTLRPPATTANYHSDKSEVLFDDLLHLLLSDANVLTVIVPRTHEQTAQIAERIANIADAGSRCILLDSAVDGLQLTFASDLLISGGGTMNREAALLGVPVYSIFAGRQGSLDRQMESEGKITFIRDARDLSKIRLERRDPRRMAPLTDRVEKFVIGEIEKFL